MGILTEHYGGAFPFWLAPVQALIIPVSQRHFEYARAVEAQLRDRGFRARADLRNEKMGYKIREGQIRKVPFMLIVGDREVENRNLSVRNRFEGDLGARSLEDFVDQLRELVATKSVRP